MPDTGPGMTPEYDSVKARFTGKEINMDLITKRLLLRPWQETDAESLYEYAKDPGKSKRVQEKCGFTYHHTKKDFHWKEMNDIRTEHVTCITKDRWENG